MTDPHQRSIRDLVDRLTGPAAAAADHPTDAVVVRPSDTLIVRIDPTCPVADAHRVLVELRGHLPDARIVVLAAVDMAVHRPESAQCTCPQVDVASTDWDGPFIFAGSTAPDCPTHSKRGEADDAH